MRYTTDQLYELQSALEDRTKKLQALQGDCLRAASGERELVIEYMSHGVGRRLSILRHAITTIFSEFPPSTTSILERNALMRVQINLQAFFINLIGVFDNWAWSYVYLHSAEATVGGKHGVDMFKEATQRILPAELSLYLGSTQTKDWHSRYLKNYRDALAHRIPLYIPPSTLTQKEREDLDQLEKQRYDSILRYDFDKADKLKSEADTIGSPCFYFLHSFSEENAPRPIMIHPQVLSDAETVVEFGNLFLANWRTAPTTGPRVTDGIRPVSNAAVCQR